MLSVISDQGLAADWWFMYKLPHGQMVPASRHHPEKPMSLSGDNYLYYQEGASEGLALSSHKLGNSGALYNTLGLIFSAARRPDNTVGWVLYNDEKPNSKTNDKLCGHCKGLLAFDKERDEGIWVLHSTPKFPLENDAGFPADEHIYAQSFIAITLDGFQAVNDIASQLRHQQEPQVYAYKLPKGVASDDEIHGLCIDAPVQYGSLTNQISFKSKAGKLFKAIAKNRRWEKDFWIDLVGPALGVDLAIETWRRLKIPADEDLGELLDVRDIGGIDLSPLGVASSWKYTHDHAKWAIESSSGFPRPEWVCVADINRQISQEKRGGGSICFREAELHKALASIELFTWPK